MKAVEIADCVTPTLSVINLEIIFYQPPMRVNPVTYSRQIKLGIRYTFRWSESLSLTTGTFLGCKKAKNGHI